MTHRNNTIAQQFAERLPQITNAVLGTGRTRAAEGAQSLSRKGAMKASAELCNAAMSRLLEYLYEVDDTSLRANVDATGRLLIPVPWGSSYRRYGLRATEAAVLATHMRRLAERTHPPLLIYDDETRNWLLNIDYTTHAAAVDYWNRCRLTAGDYLALSEHVRNNR
jgi:hypothetical protein